MSSIYLVFGLNNFTLYTLFTTWSVKYKYFQKIKLNSLFLAHKQAPFSQKCFLPLLSKMKKTLLKFKSVFLEQHSLEDICAPYFEVFPRCTDASLVDTLSAVFYPIKSDTSVEILQWSLKNFFSMIAHCYASIISFTTPFSVVIMWIIKKVCTTRSTNTRRVSQVC